MKSIPRILRERRLAGLTQHEVARPLGKTAMWLSLAERGLIGLDPVVEAHVLKVIRRLDKFNETTKENKEKIFKLLKVR